MQSMQQLSNPSDDDPPAMTLPGRMQQPLLSSPTILFLLLSGLLLTPLQAAAKNIYKYQDAEGIWHYTDRAPLEDQPFETVYMEREPEPRIRLRREGTEASPVYLLFNDFWGPVEVEISLTDTFNVITEPALPTRVVIPGQTEQAVVGLAALDQRQGFSYRFQLSSVPGPPVATPLEGLLLYPPFPLGQSYPVSQGFNGDKTHNSPDSQYAIDIVMPVGTTILAARAGLVMDVEQDFKQAGTNMEQFADKANHVRILHDDGSMALYAHLDLASVSVRPGARVRSGQRIARSGNTGFSSGPHLHFALQQNTGMQMISLPFQFHQPGGTPTIPQQGLMLEGASD